MIKQLEIDGVPTVLAPTSGPMHAGLVFRVGLSDETLARHGITHLIEHLALHQTGVTDYHYNGATGLEHTFFHLQGSEADIVAFLTGVCASLRDLPMGRLATEKEILRTEENSRRGGVTEALPLWRHGARDFGLPGLPEWGLPALTPDDLRDWVARFFTRDNAALWIAGDAVPAGLTLDLPAGVRQPMAGKSSALSATPAWFGGSAGAVAWDSEVRREPRAAIYAGVLERAMFRSLRQDGGLSYTVQTDYEPRSDGTAMVTAVADALPEKQAAVLGGFLDVLAALRYGPIDPADVTTVINQRCEALQRAEEQGTRLPAQAFNLLSGRAVQSLDDAVAELRAVTPADVSEVAEAAWSTGLLRTPRGAAADWAGFVAAPTSSPDAVPGTFYPSLEDPGVHLIVGDQGVTIVDQGTCATVRFDACAAMLAWPDGARQLVGHDAIMVRLEPTLYAGSIAALPWVDTKIPPSLRVDMPAREADRIPVPQPIAAAAAPAAPRGKALPIIAIVVLSPIALIFAVFTLIGLTGLGDDGDVLGAAIFLAIVCLLITAGSGYGIYRAIRRLRRVTRAGSRLGG